MLDCEKHLVSFTYTNVDIVYIGILFMISYRAKHLAIYFNTFSYSFHIIAILSARPITGFSERNGDEKKDVCVSAIDTLTHTTLAIRSKSVR